MSYKVEDGANMMQVCYVPLSTFYHMGFVIVRDAHRFHDNFDQIQEHSKCARPATSCHCWFKAECSLADLKTGFIFENSCIARERHPCTYFALLGYNGCKSGGYGGN